MRFKWSKSDQKHIFYPKKTKTCFSKLKWKRNVIEEEFHKSSKILFRPSTKRNQLFEDELSNLFQRLGLKCKASCKGQHTWKWKCYISFSGVINIYLQTLAHPCKLSEVCKNSVLILKYKGVLISSPSQRIIKISFSKVICLNLLKTSSRPHLGAYQIKTLLYWRFEFSTRKDEKNVLQSVGGDEIWNIHHILVLDRLLCRVPVRGKTMEFNCFIIPNENLL